MSGPRSYPSPNPHPAPTPKLSPIGHLGSDSPFDRPADVRILTTIVDGHRVRYTAGGHGPTIILLHGWGLGHNAYRRGLRRLAQAGFSVVAPALPGFGGTPDLGPEARNFAGYAGWVTRFAQALKIRRAVLVGHSFGGGVSIQTAQLQPGLVRSVVLLNSVGAPWRSGKVGNEPMADRPMWSWGLNIPSDVVSLLGHAASAMPNVLEDLVPNVLRNPFGVARVGKIARTADLLDALRDVKRRHIPITIVHSEDDGIIPESSFDVLCQTAGVNGITVPGNHSWPLTNPDVFCDIVVKAAFAQRSSVA